MPKAKRSPNQPKKSLPNQLVRESDSATVTQSPYDEQQNDEIEVLHSVFPDDFEEVETKGAWSKKTEKSFSLKLASESDTTIFVRLSVTFTATYPKTAPLLALTYSNGVPDKTQEKIENVIATRPKELLGEVMILELSNDIRDVLEDAAQALADGRAVPSLEEQRVQQEAEAEKLAREDEEREARRLASARASEERAMQQMVEDELRKREIAREKQRSALSNDRELLVDHSHDVWFDNMIERRLGDGHLKQFQSVRIVKVIASGQGRNEYEVRPANESDLDNTSLMILKKLSIGPTATNKSILDFEDALENLKSVSHEALLNIFGFKMERHENTWCFNILTEMPTGSTIQDILAVADSITIRKAKGFAVDILRALEFLHKRGLVHGAVKESNVFICDSGSGRIAKLANSCFSRVADGVESKNSSARRLETGSSSFSTWACPNLRDCETEQWGTHKSDIWDFGVLLAKITFGKDVTSHYTVNSFLNSPKLSDPFQVIMLDLLQREPRRRPAAFDATLYEFLRTDAEAILQPSPYTEARASSRRDSVHRQASSENANAGVNPSRYTNEWFELGRLGRGGYGEVVKARNKLDGRTYAVKKIAGKTQAQLSDVLSEVYLLATLNHPHVVRYFTAWPEDEIDQSGTDIDSSLGTSNTASNERSASQSPSDDATSPRVDFNHSTGGVDFISSAGYPKIEFDDSDASETSSDDGHSSIFERDSPNPERVTGPANLTKSPKQHTRPSAKATLYIQMEFCERLTLRDIIRRSISENVDEIWRILQHIVEGLAHIHNHGIIHRDLKPENIFMDLSNNPKIGDFGLATTGKSQIMHENSESDVAGGGNLTLSVGTALYVAPEVKSGANGNYSEKVDMYSLGIILFEMCCPLSTAMERVNILSQLRLKEHHLPDLFHKPRTEEQRHLIESLVNHKPSERPSSTEILRGGMIPIRVEDAQVEQALSKLTDPSSPFFNRMMDTLFVQQTNSELQKRLWNASKDSLVKSEAGEYVLMQSLVKGKMISVFRRYGAIETSRPMVFPKSSHYASNDVAQFIDGSGTLVQLPYDLILPHARMIASQTSMTQRSFAFGTVFRSTPTGGPPRNNREADFDIISHSPQNLVLTEAEVIKCIDDLVHEFPCFASTNMCFHISHSTILESILDFCRIPKARQPAAKSILGKLHIGQWDWSKIKTELRAPSMGVASSSIEDLVKFDFRDVPERAFKRLQAMFKGTKYLDELQLTFTQISGLTEYLKRLGIRRKLFFSPLSSLNEPFYRRAIMFQCLFDGKKRDILAAGGRYDALIEDQSPHTLEPPRLAYAVGTNIAWDRIVTSMARYRRQSGGSFLKNTSNIEIPEAWKCRRFDVLVSSFDATILHSVGIRLVGDLRANHISAEVAVNAHSPEELLTQYQSANHSWTVIIKHEGLSSGKADLKVRSMESKGESTDVQSTELVNYIRGEIREREQREGHQDRTRLSKQTSQGYDPEKERKNDVHVLMAQHKSKKSNKARIIEDAHNRVNEFMAAHSEGPVAAVESRDEIILKLYETRLSDADSWRKLIQSVPLSERQYCHELMDLLEAFKAQYGDTYRKCFVFNFRTGFCIDYDLNRNPRRS